jgi:hypothetical protein
LGEASYATSSLTTTVNEFGALFQATKKVEKAIHDLNKA